uniref:Hedgehog acyltransferase n=1 Tax=Petromyzon marinus TaxID=7757 RepID=S4RUF4_PETMA
YAFHIVHLVSREHEEELHAEFELEKGFFAWGFKKDPTDFEWTFWSHWASSRLLWMLLGHVLLSQLFSHSAPQLRPWGWLVYGLACCTALLGARGAAVVLAHALASYAAAQLRRPALCWLTNLGLLAGLQAAHWSHTQRVDRGWYESENEYFLLLFTLAMTNLRCTSFSLELCRQGAHPAAGSSLFWPLVYTFYYPPIMSYCDFVARMPRLPLLPLLPLLPRLPWLAVRVAAWWVLAELMLHLGYFSVLHQHEELLESLPSATLACLAIAHVSFFYVKYLVLFGVPSLAMHLDGVQPPPLPRCVSITHGFSDMWRNFDVGLHRWLLRYVYVPLGGSQGGALRQAVSCGAVFLYVFFWHGAQAYLLFWATLNWLGVTVETGLGRALSSTPAERLSL